MAEHLVGERSQMLLDFSQSRPVPSPIEVLRRFAEVFPDGFVESGVALQIWGEAGQRPELREQGARMIGRLQEGLQSYLTTWLHEGRGLGQERAAELAVSAAPALLGIMQGFLVRGTILSSLDVESYFTGLAALSRFGLLAEGEE